MTIRKLRLTDIPGLYEIWKKYYINDFTFPDFYEKYLFSNIIVDENDQIISLGAVRVIPEAVFITDKNRSIRQRKFALESLLELTMIELKDRKFDQLHAQVNDENWKNVLVKYGFNKCAGTVLVKNG
jgi:hypothetical protein